MTTRTTTTTRRRREGKKKTIENSAKNRESPGTSGSLWGASGDPREPPEVSESLRKPAESPRIPSKTSDEKSTIKSTRHGEVSGQCCKTTRLGRSMPPCASAPRASARLSIAEERRRAPFQPASERALSQRRGSLRDLQRAATQATLYSGGARQETIRTLPGCPRFLGIRRVPNRSLMILDRQLLVFDERIVDFGVGFLAEVSCGRAPTVM